MEKKEEKPQTPSVSKKSVRCNEKIVPVELYFSWNHRFQPWTIDSATNVTENPFVYWNLFKIGKAAFEVAKPTYVRLDLSQPSISFFNKAMSGGRSEIIKVFNRLEIII